VLVFLLVGGFGLVLLLGGLLLGDLLSLDGLVDLGPITTPAVGAALAAFGFGGALALASVGVVLATVLGALAAVLLGAAAVLATQALLGSPTEPVRTAALLGVFGTVVTRIPEGGLGEVVMPLAGTRAKFAARSHEPVPAGTPVYVVEVLSETSVVVQRADLLNGEPLP